MNYFRNYPIVNYQFGSSGVGNGLQRFQNLTTYVDVLDQFRDNVGTYQYYFILEGDRPDVVSNKLYGRPDLHWTFWLMNDHIRESGWPLDRPVLEQLLVEDYPGVAVVTRTDFWGTLPDGSNIPGQILQVGDVLTGSASATTATVTEVDVNNGQIYLDGDDLFTAGEAATWTDSNGVLRTIVVESSTTKINSIHHVENADGDIIDYDPTVGPGALDTEHTIKDDVLARNEALREIRIIQPKYIEQVVNAFKEAL